MADSILMSSEVKELGPSSSIIKLLECPVCQGVPIPPVWNCMNGHISCDQCKSQLNSCGLCREPFTGGRNFFMEQILSDCTLTCPYSDAGCTVALKGDFIKTHASECKWGPKIKWIACHHSNFPPNAVEGGKQNGVKLYVIRAKHQGSNSPGKLFEYLPPGSDPDMPCASLAWGGGERMKHSYEVLVALPGYLEWIPSEKGVHVPLAVPGGVSEHGETLYIGRYKHENNMINGKVHPSHEVCYIGADGKELASTTYEILVNVEPSRLKNLETEKADVEEPSPGVSARNDNDMPAYYS